MYYTSPGGQCSHCDVALTKDYFSVVSSKKQREALLSIVDERTYSEIRGKAEFRLGIPLLDEFISAGADWENFSKAQRNYLEQVGWHSDLNHTIKQLQVVTSPVAYRYWAECVQACSRNRYGFHGWVTHETEDAVMVTLYFNGTSGTPAVRLNGTLVGGTVGDLPEGKLFAPDAELLPGDTMSVVIKRKPGQTMTVGITPTKYEGFLFYSEWLVDDPCAFGSLTVETTTITNENKFITTRSTSGVTENHHEDRSDGQPRSPDNKYRASDLYIELNASPGRVLREPELAWARIEGLGSFSPRVESGQGYPSHSSILNLGVMGDGTKAVATVRAWTWPIAFSLTAKEYEVSEKLVTTSETATMARGRPMEVRVPNGASATLKLTVCGRDSVCNAGEDSKDKVLCCLTSVRGLVATQYVYQYS